MIMIKPISLAQQQQVTERTADVLRQAGEIYQRQFSSVAVAFDLKGKAAGMYCVRGRKRWIRYNPFIFAKYFTDNLETTVPHEVAHYVIDLLYGQSNVRPHGKEWSSLMLSLGVEPERTCEYDLDGIPVRVYRLFDYVCDCSRHQLSSRRHNRVERGQMQYFCKLCRQQLVPA